MAIEHQSVDLSLCDREPIRIPGSIQPHGFLVALDAAGLAVAQVSDNLVAFTGVAPAEALGKPLSRIVGEAHARRLLEVAAAQNLAGKPHYFGSIEVGGHCCDVLAHSRDGLLLFEFEAAPRREAANLPLIYSLLNAFLDQHGESDSIEEMSRLAAQEIKAVTGYGRVLVYRFDEHDHGHVLAEARDDDYRSYLNQRFPASDVPRQARELYVANRIRMIHNADYLPSMLVPADNPLTGRPTDLTYSSLRSVSPVHVRYMKNMHTYASMSVSLVVKGRLWGLISCHNAEPKFVPFEARVACEHLGQILSLRIESKEESIEAHNRLELRRILVSMLAALSQGTDFLDSLGTVSHDLLRFAGASGAAVVFEGRIARFGAAPSEDQIKDLVQWLAASTSGELYHTDALATVYPGGNAIKGMASGILALPISQIHRHYLIWFRAEVVQTIDWAGDPHAKAENTGPAGELTPRKSFDVWRETVHGTAPPWRRAELEIALEFRSAMLGVVLERAEQMAELAEELGRANKELESFSYSVSHDLRAPLRHIVGFADLLVEFEQQQLSERGVRFLRNIKDSARFAGKLVDDLLSFSQMGRAALRLREVDMDELVRGAVDKLSQDAGARNIEWKIAPLPVIQGDPAFLQLALYNLLSNAVKYSRSRDPAVITIDAEENANEFVFHVRDNGVGFNMEYAHKLFGVFQRLHRMEEFEGTGIGLANVRRIVERHGGRAWAEGAIDQGAVFSFAIPRDPSLLEE